MSQANSEATFQQARDLYKNGKHNEALVIFDHHLVIKKNEFDIYQKTKCFFLNLKKYEQALEIFDKILEDSPKDSEILARKGCMLEILSRYDDALQCFDTALEIDPKNVTAMRNKGILLMNTEKYEQALEIFDKILEDSPKDSEILYNKGYALERSGKNDESISYYFKALCLDGNNFDDLQNLGLLLIHYLGGNNSLDISKLNSKSEDIIVKTAAQLIENTKKINALYQKYLYRDADPEGLFLYQRKILGGTSIESVENEFKKSEEAKSSNLGKEFESQIAALYKKYLRREPDLAGMNYFKHLLLGGTSIESIENEFKKSEERSELLETSDLRDYSDF